MTDTERLDQWIAWERQLQYPHLWNLGSHWMVRLGKHGELRYTGKTARDAIDAAAKGEE